MCLAMINLALSLYETGEVSRAKSLLERAIPTLKRFLPAKHPLILNGKCCCWRFVQPDHLAQHNEVVVFTEVLVCVSVCKHDVS